MTTADVPKPGSVWQDAGARELHVAAVFPRDPSGREVRGMLASGEGYGRRDDHYSCTLVDWARTWRDRTPAAMVLQ